MSGAPTPLYNLKPAMASSDEGDEGRVVGLRKHPKPTGIGAKLTLAYLGTFLVWRVYEVRSSIDPATWMADLNFCVL